MRSILRHRWYIFALEALLVVIAAVGVVVLNPWTANHFGYALPGTDGLPFRIHYGGRDYANPGYCAGADWCQGRQRTCWSQAYLQRASLWPLAEVGQVPALLGRSYPISYPIMNAAIPPGFTPTLIFVPIGSCYVVYALEGGP